MASPFRPLQAFTEAERGLFFGREREIADLALLVAGERPNLLLVGESGIGKTSLVRAGLMPQLEGRGIACQYFEAGELDSQEVLVGKRGALVIIDDVGAALDDGPRFEQLLALLGRAAVIEGLRLLFVANDEDLWRLERLEGRAGRLSARQRLGPLDRARTAEIIERTVLAGGAYFEAGLSQEVAADLAARGAVSPSELQLVAAAVVALRLTSARAYHAAGGAEPIGWRYLERACALAGGERAVRVLGAIAELPARGVATQEDLAAAAALHLADASRAAGALETQHLVRHGDDGYGLAHEWLRERARTFTGAVRGRRVQARLTLRRRMGGRGLLAPGELWTVRRHAGTLADDEAAAVRRSVRAYVLAAALLIALPVAALVAVYRGYARGYYFDGGDGPGAPVVVRLGRPRMAFGGLPHTPPFGAVIADSGFARGALAGPLPPPDGRGDPAAWLRGLVAALRPLPRGLATLVADGDLAELTRAYESAPARAAVVDVVGAVGRGGAAELALLGRALADPSEEVRRHAVAAAAVLEHRVTGSAGALLATALQDALPTLRAQAMAEVAHLPDEQAAALAAAALARGGDPIVRRSALDVLGQVATRSPAAAVALAQALGGPARSDAAAVLGRLCEGSGPTAEAAEAAVTALALDPKASDDARLEALRLLRRRPTTPPALAKIAGSPRVLAAAMPLNARADAEAAAARVAEAMHGPAPLRAAAAATIGLLPHTADTPKLLKVLENDSTVEVRVEAMRALPVLGAAALPPLIKEAKAGGVEVERAAVETLGAQWAKLGSGALTALETIARTARLSTRRAAIEALGHVGEQKPALAVAVLGRLVHDKAVEVRQAAAGALGDLLAHRPDGARDAVAALRGVAHDPDGETRRRAAEALGRAHGPSGAISAKALAAFAADVDAPVRTAAAAAMGAIGAPARGGPVWATLVGDKDATVRAAARRAAREAGVSGGEIDRALLATFAGAAPAERVDVAATAALLGGSSALRAALADAEPAVRRAAAENAAGLDEAHAAVLVAALSDSDGAVRLAAVRGLVGAKAVGPLVQAAVGVDVDVRIAALEALGQLGAAGGAAALAPLAAALDDGSERVRAAAARGLGRRGADAAPLLERALADAALDVRDAAVVGLGAAWAERPAAELRDQLSDELHADRRYAAALALARRSDPQRGQGADATHLLEDVAVHGTPLGQLAARLARAFAGRADAMPALLHLLRHG